jgi:hypothetical protein
MVYAYITSSNKIGAKIWKNEKIQTIKFDSHVKHHIKDVAHWICDKEKERERERSFVC